MVPFDVNFLNFEDPEVFKRLTGPDYKKCWKETFGYDWVNQQKIIGGLRFLREETSWPVLKII